LTGSKRSPIRRTPADAWIEREVREVGDRPLVHAVDRKPPQAAGAERCAM
jgi:hypothetical protein